MPVEVRDPINATDLMFNLKAGCAIYREAKIRLPPKQLQILQFIHSRHSEPVSNLDLRIGVWGTHKREKNLPEKTISLLNAYLSGEGFHVYGTRDVGYQIVLGEKNSSGHNRHKVDAGKFGDEASSIQAFKDWGAANPIISRAQNSLVIIDSYFGHSGEIEPLIKCSARSFVPA